ncbi:hypothetical protein WG78_07190 [Amantichitinum ursilacus]|uniref:SmpA / OmlA family protein n=2 Tax=Amantichitinum ursilacus TaxID=857265 RepID=A0A0N0XLM9_9NEIS|nr:hypothetical protein WG78_07190 [Amantichitinum ursilacus]
MRRFCLPALFTSALLLSACALEPITSPEIAMGSPIVLPNRVPTYATLVVAAPEKPRHKPKAAKASKVASARAAPGSLFARLKPGMSRRQVEALIGLPGDVRSTRAAQGKAASSPSELVVVSEETFYKQEGSLVFGKGGTVLTRINVDTGANGIQ